MYAPPGGDHITVRTSVKSLSNVLVVSLISVLSDNETGHRFSIQQVMLCMLICAHGGSVAYGWLAI